MRFLNECERATIRGRQIATVEQVGSQFRNATVAQSHAIKLAGLFSALWKGHGSQILKLDHSIAALLATTKSQPLDWEHLPFSYMVIDVPHEFCPAFPDHPKSAPTNTYLALGHQKGSCIFGVVCDDNICGFGQSAIGEHLFGEEMSLGNDPNSTSSARHQDARRNGLKIGVRIASNVINFVNQHRECVVRSTRRDGTSSNVATVCAPRSIAVDRQFRDLAKQLVGSTSFAGAKRALSHMVRGHWRNQAVGEGRQERKLTWVRPFRRGDESLGRVVERVTRLGVQP